MPRSQVKKGLAVTTALAAAAGLAAAAIIALKKRGVDPKAEGKKLAGRAKTAGSILSREGKGAYREVRQIVIDDLVKSDEPVTKTSIHRIIESVLAALKARGSLTKQELQALGRELKNDWRAVRETVQGEKNEDTEAS